MRNIQVLFGPRYGIPESWLHLRKTLQIMDLLLSTLQTKLKSRLFSLVSVKLDGEGKDN